MSKPNSKVTVRLKPFFEDKKIAISTIHQDHMIKGFKMLVKDKKLTVDFLAKGKKLNAITVAWQTMEKFADKHLPK